MKPLNILPKFVLVWLTLSVTTMIAHAILPIHMAALPNAGAWWTLSNAIVAAALTFLALKSEIRGWQLALALSGIPLLVQTVNLVEGKFFLGNVSMPWGSIFLSGALAQLFAIPGWMLIFRSASAGQPPLRTHAFSVTARLWRFVAADGLYLFLYFFAGILVFPFVAEYYKTQTIPPLKVIIGLQLLLRGPVFVILCVLMARMLRISSWLSALQVGLIFTIISGVATLIVPNPFFPDAVRWAHFCEVVSSNFVFGSLVALLWRTPGPERNPVVHGIPATAA